MQKNTEHFSHQKEKLSSWILDYDKNAYCDPKISHDSRELLVDSFNECSDLRKSFHNSLNEFFSNLGFSSMNHFHKYDNSFTNYEKATHAQHNNKLGLDIGFSFIKDNSEINLGNKKNTNKKKTKDKGKSKNIISLKKKFLKNEIENYKENDFIESDNEDSDEKKIDKYKKEKDSEKDGDYFLNSIYNQFGISNKNKIGIKEESKDNKVIEKEENKIFKKENKNIYSKKISEKIKDSNIKSSENQDHL